MTTHLTCEQRINNELKSTLEMIRAAWEAYPEANEDYGSFYELGLSFDYVTPETFENQSEGYFRYQLSWGGLSDEFRIYADQTGEYRWSIYRIEYWFMDWFDGASRQLHGATFNLMENIIQTMFVDIGALDSKFEETLVY